MLCCYILAFLKILFNSMLTIKALYWLFCKHLAQNGTLRKTDTMDMSLAKIVMADCKVDEQNHQYDNPADEMPCTCLSCWDHPVKWCPTWLDHTHELLLWPRLVQQAFALDIKHREMVGMIRYDCQSKLVILCAARGNDNTKRSWTVTVRLHHYQNHLHYYDVSLPPIRENVEWSSPVSITPKVQAVYPQVTARQVHTVVLLHGLK